MQVELRDIRKYFGRVKANDGISVVLEPGKIYALVGENGAGKSTLMKILSGYQPPTSGEIFLDGRPAQFHSPADALAKGATLHCGGHRAPGPGNWFEPTVFSGVDHRMELMREESFGPIIGIQKVSGDAEAVRLMNDTRYGLTAGVHTPDGGRARRLLSQVHAGSAYWNCCDRVSPRLPWSGHGDSGVGLTLSTYGIAAFTRPKAWHLRRG